jgi:hypothetical protein
MRWERLFEDLEDQAAAVADDALDAEIADRLRHALATTVLEDRLRAAVGRTVELCVAGTGGLVGIARRVGPGWLLLDPPGGSPALVVTAAVTAVRNLPLASRARVLEGEVAARAGVAHLLRMFARDRTPTRVSLRDGSELSGTIDRVGSDYLDLAEHPLDEPRLAVLVEGVRSIPFGALAALRPRLD